MAAGDDGLDNDIDLPAWPAGYYPKEVFAKEVFAKENLKELFAMPSTSACQPFGTAGLRHQRGRPRGEFEV